MEQLTYKARIKAQKTLHLLRDVAFELDLDREIEKKATELIIKYFHRNPDARTSPSILLSALLYYAGKMIHLPVSRKEICRVLNVSPKWAASQYRMIMQRIDQT